jgi:hypothetical protein
MQVLFNRLCDAITRVLEFDLGINARYRVAVAHDTAVRIDGRAPADCRNSHRIGLCRTNKPFKPWISVSAASEISIVFLLNVVIDHGLV